MRQEALNLVDDLNDEMFDRLEYYLPFEFRSYGWDTAIIYFMGVPLWTEDTDEREYEIDSDEKEPLRDYIIREANVILQDLNLKMKTNKLSASEYLKENSIDIDKLAVRQYDFKGNVTFDWIEMMEEYAKYKSE